MLVLPTASAPEGDEVFSGWATSGLEHFTTTGVPAEVLDVRDRTDADDVALADRVVGASVVYFSGGNPVHLAKTLAETALWRAVLSGLDRGMGYIGCSAGMACLGRKAPDSTVDEFSDPTCGSRVSVCSLGPGSGRTGTCWTTSLPGLVDHLTQTVPADDLLVGVDEQTALVGDGEQWQVVGRGGVHVRHGQEWSRHGAGETVSVSLSA